MIFDFERRISLVPAAFDEEGLLYATTRFGDFPRTEAAYLRLLSLPMFPDLEEKSQDRVVEVLRGTLDRLRRG